MPRRLQDLQPHLSELQDIALSKSSKVKIGLSLGAQTNRGADAVSELDVAREEISVKMGEENVVNVKVVLDGVVEVLIDIALRVDDNGSSGRLIGNEVRCMCKTAKIILF